MKLKEFNFNIIEYSKKKLNGGTVFNLSYESGPMIFQSPKVLVKEILNFSKDSYFLIIEFINNKGSDEFMKTLQSFEKSLSLIFKNNLESLVKGNTLKVKIPFKKESPVVKIYSQDQNLLSLYSLVPNQKIILLLNCKYLWIPEFPECHNDNNDNNEISYNIHVEEIMVF